MNRPTKSEELFKRYCADQSYQLEKIQEGVEQTPDFRVATQHGHVIAEIKEVCPNEEEIAIAKNGGGTHWHSIGKRVRAKIEGAMSQTKKYRSESVPCILVLFDNIVVDGVRPLYPNYYFNPGEIAFGMYGELKVVVSLDKSSGQIIKSQSMLGGKRKLRPDQGNEISAVCILNECFEQYPPSLLTYHNAFAKIPLSRALFAGPYDKHFKNLGDEVSFDTSWVEF